MRGAAAEVVTKGEGAGKGTPRACGRETTWQDWLLRTLLLVVLITYLLLGFFADCADDYCYASRVRELGVFKGIGDHYLSWSGRYTASAVYFFWSWLMERTDFGLYWLTPKEQRYEQELLAIKEGLEKTKR